MSAHDFVIRQGSTFNPTLKWAQPQFTVKTITGISKSGQAVVTAAGHGLAVDWPVWIVGVVGMVQINHASDALKAPSKAYQAYYVSSSSLRLNLDSSQFSAYASGGELLYHPPVDLTGYTARMQVRASVDDDTVLQSLTTENGGITLGGANGTIALLITATDTAAYEWTNAVYDLELITGSVVTSLLDGNIRVEPEVTRA